MISAENSPENQNLMNSSSNHFCIDLNQFNDYNCISYCDEINDLKPQEINTTTENESSFLQKKTKRTKKLAMKKKSKSFSSKLNTISKIFYEFKKQNEVIIKEFKEFNIIEKEIINNCYKDIYDFDKKMKFFFHHNFYTFSLNNNFDSYLKNLELCQNFKIFFEKYDNNLIEKECKNLQDSINKLRKEIKYIENRNNGEGGNYAEYSMSSGYSKDIKSYKNELADNIRKLSPVDQKGLSKLIHEKFMDKSTINGKVMEFDINILNITQLNILENYVNKCLNINKNENDLKGKSKNEDNDLSSFLSDDESEDD